MKCSVPPSEFAGAWTATKLGTYPYPLWVRGENAGAPDESARRRDRQRPAELDEALWVLSAPELRITVMGDRGERHGTVRMLAGVRADRAALAVQRPGLQPREDGMVDVWLGSPAELGAQIAHGFPRAPIGRGPDRTASNDRVRAATPQLDAGSPSDPAEIRRLLAATRDAEGYLRVEPGLSAGADAPRPEYLHWIDVADDGRYLIQTDDGIQVTPASPAVLGARLQTVIESRIPQPH